MGDRPDIEGQAEPTLRRNVAVLASVVLAVLITLEATYIAVGFVGPDPTWDLGMDYRYYVGLAERWLADGVFYLPHQLVGPHEARLLGSHAEVDTLYPPSALFLFVPLVWLPTVLWWALPIAATFAALASMRPTVLVWPLMLVLLAWPRAIGAYLFGNTDMVMVAAVAGGLTRGWPAILVTIKPSLAPLALIGIRHRGWWILAGLGMISVVLMLPLWSDYVTAMRNVRGLGLEYGLGSLPLMAIPIVAWIGRAGGPLDRRLRPRPIVPSEPAVAAT